MMVRPVKLCGKEPAEVPDRDKGAVGRQIKEVCRPCHGKRLQEDLDRILRKPR